MENGKKKSSYTALVLVVLLAIAAFLAGSFFTKIQYQKSQGQEAKASPTPTTVAQKPQELPAVLGAAETAKIAENAAAVKGKEDALVTIVEFSEYQCPFCKRYVDQTYFKIWEKYGDSLRYIFQDYPLAFHSHAQKLAEAARCAGEQDKYWQMHDLLFEMREEWVEKQDIVQNLTSYAQRLALNVDQFDNCLSSGKFTQAVKDSFALGQEVGVSGTPTFFINGRKLVGAQPFENFAKIIDDELKKAESS